MLLNVVRMGNNTLNADADLTGPLWAICPGIALFACAYLSKTMQKYMGFMQYKEVDRWM